MKLKTPSRAATSLTLGMVLLVATTIFAQQLSTPRSNDATTTKLICSMIGQYHISQSPIDDRISNKLLKRFITQLDPQKLYFTQADIDQFEKYHNQLDDLVKVGDVDFAYKTFDRYLKRLDQRIKLAQSLIDEPHDFSIDETMVTDADTLSWAKTEDEIKERWRKRIKFDLVTLIIDDTELKEARKRLHRRYRTIRQTVIQTEDMEKLEIYLSSLTHCFDPHSSYMSPQTLEDFRISMELKLEGIGAALRSEDGITTVAQIVPGGAADKDGRLKVGDKIVGVGQAEGDLVDIVEMKLTKVVRYIRGKKGTKVRLQIKPADGGKNVIYELTRRTIELKSSEVKGEIIKTGDRLKGTQARIGVVNIPSFYRDFRGAQRGDKNFKSTARDVLKVLNQFRDNGGVDAVVIDLRTNGGGALSEAIEVSGLFIDKGPVVQVKEQNGRIKSHNDVDPGVAYSGPLVVLCNRLSASASEIFAGAIKDYGRGLVVGDKTTHGKGTVQNVMPVSRQLFQFLNRQDLGALKLTINQFYRVNGDSTQNRGVESDVVLPSLIDHMDFGESFLDNALAFDHIKAAKHKNLGMVNGEIVSALRTSSKKRVVASEKFQETQKDIERFLKRKNRKEITLNEAKLRKERAEDKKDKGKDKDKDKETDLNKEAPIFPEGYYNDEVLQVTVDYVKLLKGLVTARK